MKKIFLMIAVTVLAVIGTNAQNDMKQKEIKADSRAEFPWGVRSGIRPFER